MDASPAWVDDVIVIFPQDGNPVSWRLKHGDDEVSYILCWLLKSPVEWSGWTMSMTSRQLYPVLLAGVRLETSSEMRKWACWEQNVSVSDVRFGKMLPHGSPAPRISLAMAARPCLSWRLRRVVDRASPTSRNEKKNWFVLCFKSFSGEEWKCDAN